MASAAAAAAATSPVSADMPVDVVTGARNPRGIPTVAFFEDVESFLTERRAPIDAALQSLQTMHGKLKLMEAALIEQKKRCKSQLPDLESSLAAVRMLISKRDAAAEAGADGDAAAFTTFFNLSEQVYAPARIVPEGRCCVWLGANVMVEYSYAEAEAMLSTMLEAAQR